MPDEIVESLRQEIERLTAVVEIRQHELDGQAQMLHDLQARLAQAEQERDRVMRDVRVTHKINKELEMALAQAEQELTSIRHTLNVVPADPHRPLVKYIEDVLRRREQAEQRITELEGYSELNDLLIKQGAQIRTLTTERDEARSQRDFAKEDRDLYFSRWQQLHQQLAAGQARVRELEALTSPSARPISEAGGAV